jgi:4'-phosphopantetheinyl transferase
MPLVKIHSLGKESAWGLWHIQEGEAELYDLTEEYWPLEIVNEQKRLEWLAGRALLKALMENLGLKYHGLRKDEFGKPFLNTHPHHISLSHSHPYVVAQIDRMNSVGIDLEQPKEKLKKIASRVFSEGEVADADDNITKLCIYWCAKEALYKIYGKRNLLFTDHLRVMPFNLSSAGSIDGKIQLPGNEIIVPLQYLVMKEFVIVYTDLQG